MAEDQAFVESEELRGLIAAGTERGYLTFEEIASTLEEVEVTKEQVVGAPQRIWSSREWT